MAGGSMTRVADLASHILHYTPAHPLLVGMSGLAGRGLHRACPATTRGCAPAAQRSWSAVLRKSVGGWVWARMKEGVALLPM